MPATSATRSSSPTSSATSTRTSTAVGCTSRRRTSTGSARTRTDRVVDAAWHDVMRFEIDRCRALYRSADKGIAMLPPSSARCIGAARTLYGEILDRIEANDYDVFTTRARVSSVRKLSVAGRVALRRP